MAEHVVEDIRLLEIVELVRLADEVAGREAAIGKMFEENIVRNEARNGDDAPAGAFTKLPVELAEIRNPGSRQLQDLERLVERLHRASAKQSLLAREQRVPYPMVFVGQLVPMLRDRPIGSGPRWRNGRRPGAMAFTRAVRNLQLVHLQDSFSQKRTPPERGRAGFRTVRANRLACQTVSAPAAKSP